MTRWKLLALQILVGVVAVGFWWVGSSTKIFGVTLLPPFFFSTPADVFSRVVRMFATGLVWRHLLQVGCRQSLAGLAGGNAHELGKEGVRLYPAGKQIPQTPVGQTLHRGQH